MQKGGTLKQNVKDYLQEFRMLFDLIRIGIIIADENGILVYYNNAQEEIDQLQRQKVLGKAMYEVYNFTPENSPAMAVLRSGKPIVDKVHSYLTRSGNHVNSSCTIYPLHSDEGAVIGVICYSQSYTRLGVQLQILQRDIEQGSQSEPSYAEASSSHYSFSSLIGNNVHLKKAIDLAKMATENASSVMIIGETGVGKEIIAQSIHYGSERGKHSYMAINCSAVPETLLEGILFGTAKGAFTGALNNPGLFEVADKGTIFLDEVDSMPLSLQSKLLRVLQERKIRRVGEAKERNVDVRIISAVGHTPSQLLQDGLLRQDFYYRLGVIRIFLPPLRERMDDVPALAKHFLHKHSQKNNRRTLGISPAAINLLLSYNWPGNVRELEHCIEASINFMGKDIILDAEHFCNACPELIGDSPDFYFQSTPDGIMNQVQSTESTKEQEMHSPRKQEQQRPNTQRTNPQPLDAHVSVNPAFSFSTHSSTSTSQHLGGTVEEDTIQTSFGSKGKRLEQAKYEAEVSVLKNALQASAGNCSMAARLLGISPQLLHYKVKKYGLTPKAYNPHHL